LYTSNSVEYIESITLGNNLGHWRLTLKNEFLKTLTKQPVICREKREFIAENRALIHGILRQGATGPDAEKLPL
jgi:hypothetical protein